jgi:hypothetical protein
VLANENLSKPCKLQKVQKKYYYYNGSMAASSGQPYNQIAILEASRSNKLSTVYFYMRAISLRLQALLLMYSIAIHVGSW